MSTLAERDALTTIVTLPRVNLLPPEIEEARRFKRVQGALGLGVIAALGVVGALLLVANGQVSSAQDDLDTQKVRSTQLEDQEAQYAEVPLVYAQVEAADVQLAAAMGPEIRWSYFFNDLSLQTPGKVWLTSMTVTPNTPAAGTTTTAPSTDYLQSGLATIVYEGKAPTQNDVAAWLDSLDRPEDGFTQPYLTSSKVDPIGDQHAVTFSTQSTVTEDALSRRYTDKAGS